MVHHGGIGTTSQCLAAGIPQLVVHMALDQPDNAARVERLGVGLGISSKNLTESRLLPLAKRCLTDKKIKESVAHHAALMQPRPSTDEMFRWVEETLAVGIRTKE
jgi:rhamnosyltransferase subunit B